MATRKQYIAEELAVLSRPKLNVICTNRGIEVAEETPDADVCKMILAQQAQEASAAEAVKPAEPAPEPAPVSHPGEGKPENPEASEPPKVKVKLKSERVWFKVMAGTQAHEKHDVFASLNGESVLIKRNHWVKLPRKFLSIFENAVQTQMENQDDDRVIERQVPRFNVQVREIEDGIPPEKSRTIL